MQKLSLSILLGNLFIAFLGIGLVIPVLPTLMNELHLSGSVVGNLVAVFAVAQLFVSPFAGWLVDKFGRKIMIVIGLLFFSFSEFLFGIAQSVEVLFFSRIIGGISAAFIMPAVTAFIADITTVEMRPKALGYMSAAISTGFIIGPGIGGFLAEIGPRIPFFVAGFLALFAGILSFITLREPERTYEEKTEKKQAGFKRVFAPKYFIALMIILITSFSLTSFESLFSLYVDHKFNFTPKDIAIAITGGAIVGAVAQVALFDRLAKWFGEIGVVRYSLIISIFLLFLMTAVSTYITVLLVTFIVFIGFDLIRPAVTSYLSKVAGNEQGFVGGMNSMFTSIGNVFGPVIGGLLFDIKLDYPFYFAAIVLAFALLLTMRWRKPEEKTLQMKENG